MSEASEFSESNLIAVLQASHKEPTKITGSLERLVAPSLFSFQPSLFCPSVNPLSHH